MSASKRVVVLGLGDTGLLVALALAARHRVTVVAPRPFYLSSQNVGGRLAWPQTWARTSKVETHRFTKLDGVEIVQGLARSVDPAEKTVSYGVDEHDVRTLHYDALVIATGADNGFWRTTRVESSAQEEQRRAEEQALLQAASTLTIVGGGASAVSMASSLSERFGDKTVALYHPGASLLRAYPPRVAVRMLARLRALGVRVHAGHRAVPPKMTGLGPATIQWESGQAPLEAELVLWAIGGAQPNAGFLPPQMLGPDGFVNVRPTLQVEAWDDVFCVGDLARTDPARSSARNNGAAIVAANVTRVLAGDLDRLRTFEPPIHKWGELTNSPESGMWLYTPRGRQVRLLPWIVRRVIFDWIVFRLLYGGVRAP
ncbi:MAG: FAD-dependent oxidoreductase [Myxococcota bacterium]